VTLLRVGAAARGLASPASRGKGAIGTRKGVRRHEALSSLLLAGAAGLRPAGGVGFHLADWAFVDRMRQQLSYRGRHIFGTTVLEVAACHELAKAGGLRAVLRIAGGRTRLTSATVHGRVANEGGGHRCTARERARRHPFQPIGSERGAYYH
jgi:hypothetical protein